jgi:poly-gamma-glutamate synthesis protein (capsule biosynthesis protein)
MLGRGVNQAAAEHGPAYVWGDLLPLLWQTDLFLVNLECAVTAHLEPWGGGVAKTFYFRADPERVEALRLGRVDGAALANNHIGDFGLTGLLDTIRRLDQAGIAVAGAGGNSALAAGPARLRARERRVHLIAFADHPAEWAARPMFPGFNYTAVSVAPEAFAPVQLAIRQAKSGADLLVFSMHWGPNMRERPSDEFRRFAHRVIDAGVDVFWGHSAHILQGVEAYRGGLILYDTGDLVDDYAVDPRLRNDRSALFILQLAPAGLIGVELVPVLVSRCQANLAREEDREWVFRRVAGLSEELGTTSRVVDDRLIIPVRRAAAQATPTAT